MKSSDEANDRAYKQVLQWVLNSVGLKFAFLLVVASSTGYAVRYVIRSPARCWIAGATARLRVFRAPVKTAGRQTATMNCLFENSRDFLRERSMFGSRATTQ